MRLQASSSRLRRSKPGRPLVGLCHRLADGSAQLVASHGLDAVPAAS